MADLRRSAWTLVLQRSRQLRAGRFYPGRTRSQDLQICSPVSRQVRSLRGHAGFYPDQLSLFWDGCAGRRLVLQPGDDSGRQRNAVVGEAVVAVEGQAADLALALGADR